MNKQVVLISFLFFFVTKNVRSQWNEIFNDTNYSWLSDVKFINNDTGFVCGASVAFPYSVVFKTTDGGNTWDTIHLSDGWLMSLSIVNDTIIYAGGQDAVSFKSIDGGLSWIHNGMIPGCCDDLSTLYYLNEDTGIAVRFNAGIWKTEDGINWTRPNFGGHSYFPNTSSIQFINDSTGYVAMDTVYKTSDYGTTWTRLNVDSIIAAKCIYMKNINDGIVVGEHGKISLTFDGGNSWTSPTTISTLTLYDVGFISDSVGFIVSGYNYFPPENDWGEIYVTRNKGFTWSLMQSFNYSLTSLQFVNDSTGFAVGKSGKIIKIINAKTINNDKVEMKNQILLFPNPFNISTTLQINSRHSNLQMSLYNILGKCVKHEFITDKFTEINRDHLSSGIYLIQISDDLGLYSTIKCIIY